MITVPPPITPLPVPGPLRTQPQVEFDANMAGWVGAQPQLISDFGASGAAAYANALDAATSAGVAAAGAAAAVAATGVLPWVSGTTYTAGSPGIGASVVSSLINFATYRRMTNGAGTVDPKNDPTNWTRISAGPAARLHVQEQQASGTTSACVLVANAWVQRIFNSLVYNTILGASLSSNTVTLPAGTYQCDISCPATQPNGHRIRLFNATSGAVIAAGTSDYTTASASASRSFLKYRFTLAAASVVRVDHWAQQNSYGGSSCAAGSPEIYADMIFEQLET